MIIGVMTAARGAVPKPAGVIIKYDCCC